MKHLPAPPNSVHLKPIPMPLYATMGTLQEAVDYIDSCRPITKSNELFSLLMVYHNTLLKTLSQKHES